MKGPTQFACYFITEHFCLCSVSFLITDCFVTLRVVCFWTYITQANYSALHCRLFVLSDCWREGEFKKWRWWFGNTIVSLWQTGNTFFRMILNLDGESGKVGISAQIPCCRFASHGPENTSWMLCLLIAHFLIAEGVVQDKQDNWD